MSRGFLIILIAFLTGCVSTMSRVSSDEEGSSISVETTASKNAVMKAASQAIRKCGYSILHVDNERGIVNSKPREVKMSEGDCECRCGREKVSPGDKRLETTVSLRVYVKDGSYSIHTVVFGNFKGGEQLPPSVCECQMSDKIAKQVLKRMQSYL